MPSILCIGDEPALNRSRAAVLRTTGCSVVESPASGALLLLQSHAYDMLLLCHTVPPAMATDIMQSARQLPRPPYIAVIETPFGSHGPTGEDVMRIDPFEGPRLLAGQVCQTLDLPAPVHPGATAKPDAAVTPIALPTELQREFSRGVQRRHMRSALPSDDQFR